MKKILFIFCSVICITSCERNTYKNAVEESSMHIRAREFTYNGHDYIEFWDTSKYGMSIVENPECKKCMELKNK